MEGLGDELVERYRSAMGEPRDSLTTPALVVELDTVRRNIAFMASRLKSLSCRLRPHVKLHKSVEVARMQVAAGAIGVCTATVWEAIVMRRGGIQDVLVANQVVGPTKIRSLAQAARLGGYTVAVDDPRNAADLSEAALTAGAKIGVLIEVDVGMRRGGVRSAKEALELARAISSLEGLTFRGVQGYEGHCMLEPDRTTRVSKAGEAMDKVLDVVDRLAADGMPCEVVSAAGTGTYDITGANPRITEIQAGSYVFMDRFHGSLVPGFEPALFVLATVTSRHGATVILDAGRKSVGVGLAPAVMAEYPYYAARSFAEEHALFDVDERCLLGLGDVVRLVPGYAPTTVNLYDVYHVIEKGVVVDLWPVFPRGPGHNGLAT